VSHPQDLPLREQAAAIASGELDPRELLQATLERIAESDEVNAVVATFPEESEKMLASAPRGPLYGLPLGIKDQFQIPWRGPRDGTPLPEALPPGESGIFRRLRDAGGVIACVTNMHWLGAGSTGHVSVYGPVGNPWNPAHCGGGSSGGSAAAVGGRLVAGAVGADGGGSVRLPAAYCGVVGIKPTFGTVPQDGNVHGYSPLDALGPFGRDAADTRLLADTLFGRTHAPGDATGLRVGLVRSPFWEDLDPEVESACADALAAAGWQLEDAVLEGAEHVRMATVIHLISDGMPDFGPEVMIEGDLVQSALSKYAALMPVDLMVRADRVRSMTRRAAAKLFERYDVLAWPTVPAPAPPIENPTVELPSGPAPADRANVRQTGLGNLTGLPGISIPVGFHSNGLPVGLQLMAPWREEARLLDAAEHIELATSREFVDRVPAYL
jgi:Asp-tRNA(Asn)/Glu-tRNA(Gln) amidotransferase A subunit family amidase